MSASFNRSSCFRWTSRAFSSHVLPTCAPSLQPVQTVAKHDGQDKNCWSPLVTYTCSHAAVRQYFSLSGFLSMCAVNAASKSFVTASSVRNLRIVGMGIGTAQAASSPMHRRGKVLFSVALDSRCLAQAVQ